MKSTIYQFRICFMLILLAVTGVQAQTTFSYQAAVRTASGWPMANKNLIVRVSIKDSAINGALLYRETHNRTTNALGLLEIEVGGGLVQTGTFNSINWGRNAKYLQTEVDTGNGNYLDLGTTQLLSVPTALYAREAGNGIKNGTAINQTMYWNGSSWVTLNAGSQGQSLTICDGQLVWATAGQCPGSVASLNCTNPTNTGGLTSGIAASGVSTAISYTGGNGGIYTVQSISSIGVTGLTATLNPGTLATGNGTLTLYITGTPSSSGSASFTLTIGAQSCMFTRVVVAPTNLADTIHCTGTTTSVIEVTCPATGRIWMDRNLGASRAATSSTDTAAYGDLYQWGRRADGHQCRNSGATTTLSSTDQPSHGNFIVVNLVNRDWRSPQNNNLWQGVNGINNPCPNGFRLPTDSELDAERASWNFNNSTGAFDSPLKLPVSGLRSTNTGSLSSGGATGTYWSSTALNVNSLFLSFDGSGASMTSGPRASGRTVRCIKHASSGGVGSINTLDCTNPTHTGVLTSGTAASGVTTAISYTGGNGGTYNAQAITSTGVTGLTATLTAGTLATGNDTLTFTITGTPTSSGTASFALTIGGQNCSFTRTVAAPQPAYPTGTVHCNGTPTAVVEVTNPVTGRIWMDRNLGASRAATSSTDDQAYGDLYQWGRRADGHQCRTSGTTTTLSSTDQPSHGNFIRTNGGNDDWRNPQNNSLWQGVNGVNNPCPSGFRLPTENELDAERVSWSQNNDLGAFASPLKLPIAGGRFSNGMLYDVGVGGAYWNSAFSGFRSRGLYFSSGNAYMIANLRAGGYAVRCIKD